MYLTGYFYSVYNQYTEIIVSLYAYSCHIVTYMHCTYLTWCFPAWTNILFSPLPAPTWPHTSGQTASVENNNTITRFWQEVRFTCNRISSFLKFQRTTSHFWIATDLWSHYKLNIITVWWERSELVAHVTLPLPFPECHGDLMKGRTWFMLFLRNLTSVEYIPALNRALNNVSFHLCQSLKD